MARLDVKTQDPERYAQVKAEQEELKLQFSMAAFGTSVARLCPYCEHMFGFDRLWIVAVTAVMLQTCFMTPPFGFALFYIKGIVPPSVKIQEIYRGVIPFILIIIAVVILVTVFPQVVYFLPNLVAS